MEKIAKLHRQSLPQTVSSQIGEEYLEWLYSQVKKCGKVVVHRRNGEIAGVMTTTDNFDKTRAYIARRMGKAQWRGILLSMLHNPGLGFKLWNRQRFMKAVAARWGKRAWILTLFVAPKWQGRGVGRAILNTVKPGVLLDTDEKTAGFYEKNNFRRIGKIGQAIVMEKHG